MNTDFSPRESIEATRVKGFFLGFREFLHLFRGNSDPLPTCIEITCLPKDCYPDGAKLLDVHLDWMRRGYIFLVEHESFPEIPLAQEVPIANWSFEIRALMVINGKYMLHPDLTKEEMREIVYELNSRLGRQL